MWRPTCSNRASTRWRSETGLPRPNLDPQPLRIEARSRVQTQRDLALARYDMLLGALRLKQASGQLTADDVAAEGRLLAP